MKLIITAGGTSERIDDVRSITNTSTGKLGYAIGRAFLTYIEPVETIYYLHGVRAVPPEGHNIKAILIEGVRDLEREISKLLTEEKIDAVVHAMAVSDYMVKTVTTLKAIQSGSIEVLSGNKISSEVEDLTVIMERSPKVISKIKALSPNTVLVGFKLLSHVCRQSLIDTAYRLLKQNNCTYVLANDLEEIGNGSHKGYLVHKDKTYDTMETNEEIGAKIAQRIWEVCR